METLCRLSYRGKPDKDTRVRRPKKIHVRPEGYGDDVAADSGPMRGKARAASAPLGARGGAALSAAQARRIFLHAQGLSRARPARRVGARQFAEYLERQGVLQLDTVNVFARAHYVPLFSRYGPYAMRELDAFLWGNARGHSAHAFEHWGHEASVMPLDLLPAMHMKMRTRSSWQVNTGARLEKERPGLIAAVRDAVEASGPVTAGELEHLAPRERPRGTWWDNSHVKDALEYLFITGDVAVSRTHTFSRTYDSTQRAWGLPGASDGSWGLDPEAARQALFDRALAADGIGTPRDLADHFRLLAPTGMGLPDAMRWAASAVERGLAEWVMVEGWAEPALLAVGDASAEAPQHRPASDPGRATGAALLSPFDPACWYRPRLERMFGMEYRIEIYTPAPQRVYGYYTLPFLLGDQMVGRVDLKADRKAKLLRVEAAWREERAVAGARRRSDAEIARALGAELDLAREWHGLEGIVVAERGNLAAELARALR